MSSAIPISTSQAASDSGQFSRFLDLPAEVRNYVYSFAFIPGTVRVLSSTGGVVPVYEHGSRKSDPERIQLEYFVETSTGLDVQQMNLSQCVITRQIYHELMHLFFTKTVWAFRDTDSFVVAVNVLPARVQRQIRKVSVFVPPKRTRERGDDGEPKVIKTYISTNYENAINTLKYQMNPMALRIYIDLEWYDRRDTLENVSDIGRRLPATNIISYFSECIPVLEIPIAKSHLSMIKAKGLWNELYDEFGANNVGWYPRGEDRYGGITGVIVVQNKGYVPFSSCSTQDSVDIIDE